MFVFVLCDFALHCVALCGDLIFFVVCDVPCVDVLRVRCFDTGLILVRLLLFLCMLCSIVCCMCVGGCIVVVLLWCYGMLLCDVV